MAKISRVTFWVEIDIVGVIQSCNIGKGFKGDSRIQGDSKLQYFLKLDIEVRMCIERLT